jgi:hypothetical protein
VERGSAAKTVTEVVGVPGNLRGVTDGRGTAPSDLRRPSVRRNDRRVRYTRDPTGMR